MREILRAILDLHLAWPFDDPWLWRGQANWEFGLEPGMHTRLRAKTGSPPLTDDNVEGETLQLVYAAQNSNIGNHEGTALTNMALLAMLQHHGAATPLLDVSLDPLLALYMAVVSPDPKRDDGKHGAVFAIKKPKSKAIEPFDHRIFSTIYREVPAGEVRLYTAPDVSERLRIQRGHFLLGKVSDSDPRVSISLTIEPAEPVHSSWIWERMESRRGGVQPQKLAPDVVVFQVAQDLKEALQKLLEARSGLTREFVFPTSWHKPHLEDFATSHRRLCGF